MRTVTPQILKALETNLGSKPLLIIGVTWVENGNEILYSDQILEGCIPGIVSINDFDTVLTIEGANDSQSISVILNDTDGTLKSILDNNDIHKRPVNIYHLFEDLPLDYKFLLFQGEINTPVVWSEGARTLEFSVLNRLEDIEVGFSMEEGDFPTVPEEALGKEWPLVFGQVCYMQAVQVTAPRRGILLQGEGIHDFTLEPRICQARKIMCPDKYVGDSETAFPETEGMTPIFSIDVDCVDDRFDELCKLFYDEIQQKSHEHSTLTIRDGDLFPQNEYITIYVEGAKFRGKFSGNTFTVMDREHPDYADFEHQVCTDVDELAAGIKRSHDRLYEGWVQTETKTAWKYEGPLETWDDCDEQGDVGRDWIGGPAESWKLYNDMESSNFCWLPAGSEVYLENEAEILYIVSLIPGTVNSVAAYKQMSTGRQLLMEVPAEYYTIYETDYNGYTVTEIGLDKKLSLINSRWSDDLYVSFTSDIGPNPVDIIEWLVEKYTSLTVDATSFAAVKTSLTNYPCNFWLKERKNIFELVNDIAYQSRCAVYVRGSVVFIKYLSLEPSSVKTLTESDINANSLKLQLTESEDLVTKHIINWRKSEAGIEATTKTERKIVLKHNINKYGQHEESYEYYTQNTFSTILKSATFWMIRKSNTWKTVEFETPLKHLDLDVFDCITLDLNVFSGKCVIESIKYSPDKNTLTFKGWTPLLAGKESQYIWAWPSLQNPLERFPTVDDEQYSGPGYDFTVTPPPDHLLRSGYIDSSDNQVIMSAGDQNPSDLDDTLPSLYCDISDTVDLDEDEPVIKELELAKRAVRDIYKIENEPEPSEEHPGAQGDREKKKERTACGSPAYSLGCIYEVSEWWITPSAVGGKCSDGGTYCCGPCLSSGCGGHPCDGFAFSQCRTFGNMASAYAHYMKKKAQLDSLKCENGRSDNYCVGVAQLYGIGKPVAIADPENWAPGGECESAPGDVNAGISGEVYEPKAR